MNKHTKILLFSMLFLLLFSLSLRGAYLRNVPVKKVQPSGEQIEIYASGDEFYNWLHDKEGFTIIQDPHTGYYVYAVEKAGELYPSGVIVTSDHRLNKANAGRLHLSRHFERPLKERKKPWEILSEDFRQDVDDILSQYKHLKVSVEKRVKPQELFPGIWPANIDEIVKAPNTGTINNIVIFIRFSDESEFTDPISTYDDMFNETGSGYNSMKNYYEEATYNQLAITTTFYPITYSTVVSYQDAQPRSYYQPYNAVTNPNGYKDFYERRYREHTLLKNAVNAVSSQVPAGLNIDGDNDGNVDNVCFIVYGGPDGWNELLWPHKWYLDTQTAYINGKRVYVFNFQLQTSLYSSGVGVLCHEMFHSIGAPDLYHYTPDGHQPVDKWGLMAHDSNPPRHMGAYMKYRYGKWIASLPEITTDANYTLNPLKMSSNNCFKILSPHTTAEYFVVEYRKRIGTFENSLPGEGLLVYRINTQIYPKGNRDGPPDEVYIYRPNGTLYSNGSPTQAAFSLEAGRTAISDTTNPSSFLSSGQAGGLNISNIGSAGGTISFDVGFPASSTLTISAGSGGTTVPAPGSHLYSVDSVVTVTAKPNTNYRFTEWTGDVTGTTNPVSVTMDTDKYIKANFIRQYTLTVSAGSGGTTNPIPGSYRFDSGADVTVTAVPDLHFRFVSWSGDFSGTTNPLTITMNADKTAVASFQRIIYPPVNFSGSREENWSLSQTEYVDVLSWQAHPNNVNIDKYRIYLDEGGSQSLVVELTADQFEYWNRGVEEGKTYKYIIVAVNDEGREGDPASVEIH